MDELVKKIFKEYCDLIEPGIRKGLYPITRDIKYIPYYELE